MLLNIYLIGVAVSLVVLQLNDYCEGRKSWKDFALVTIGALLWFILLPVALYRALRSVTSGQEGAP